MRSVPLAKIPMQQQLPLQKKKQIKPHCRQQWSSQYELVWVQYPQQNKQDKHKRFTIRFQYKDSAGKKRSKTVAFGDQTDFVFHLDPTKRLHKFTYLKKQNDPFHPNYWRLHLLNTYPDIKKAYMYFIEQVVENKQTKIRPNNNKSPYTPGINTPDRPKINPPQKYLEGVAVEQKMKELLLGSFVMLILGKPGSGKTSLLSQIVNRPQFYGQKFDRILYVTPSDIPDIQHDTDVNTCRTLDVRWIYQKVKQCSQWCQNMLIVFDDVVADIPSLQRNQLKNLFYDRRHLLPKGCISIIVTTQKYTCVPMWIRVCLNSFVSFPIQPNQIKTIATQLNTGKQKRILDFLYRNLKKHQFLWYNLEEGAVFDYQFNKL